MCDAVNPLVEAGNLQDAYEELVVAKRLTKKAMCDLCVPFRDKYKLSDRQTLEIARRELTLSQISELLTPYLQGGTTL